MLMSCIVLQTVKRISMKKNVFLSLSLLVVGLVFMQGCNWFGGSCSSEKAAPKTGEPVIKIGGQTVVTADDFIQNLDMYKQSQPMIDQILPSLPEDQQRMFYNQLVDMQVNGALLQKYADAQGWTDTQEYKATARRLHDEIDRNLAMMEFQKKLMTEFSPSDKDVVAFYEQHRTSNPYLQQAPFVTKQGGIQAVAVKAKDEAQAKVLVTSAKTRGLKKAAAEVGAKVDDLGIVTQQSTQPDRTVVFKLLSTKDFPSVDMIKTDGGWWVYEALAKKDAEYVSYEKLPKEAQEQLKNLMSNEHISKAFQERLNKLKEEPAYKVDINTAFVDSFVVPHPDNAASAQAK